MAELYLICTSFFVRLSQLESPVKQVLWVSEKRVKGKGKFYLVHV